MGAERLGFGKSHGWVGQALSSCPLSSCVTSDLSPHCKSRTALMRALSSTTTSLSASMRISLIITLIISGWGLRCELWPFPEPWVQGWKGCCPSSSERLGRPGYPRQAHPEAGRMETLWAQLSQRQPPLLKDGHSEGPLSQPESGTRSHDTDYVWLWRRNSPQILSCALFPRSQMLERKGVGPGEEALISFQRGRHHFY